jgi:DNA-binding NarL/FixJ family response regulator
MIKSGRAVQRKKGMKILLVDDSKLARMAIAKALNAIRPGWARFEAANAEEALAQVQNVHPDIAVFDFNMPGLDGVSLATEAAELRPGMPMAVISANHQTEVVERARAVGATFLSKPVSESALQEFLSSAEARLKGPPL